MIKSLKDSILQVFSLVKDKYEHSSHAKRLDHILGVAETAKKLAIKYQVDEDKAYLAGLLHDYFRYEKKEDVLYLLTEEEIKECDKTPILYHAYAASAFYLKEIGTDLDIAYSIKYHTFGKLPMSKLAEIILISDYIEPTRMYKSCIYCRQLVEKGLFYTAIYVSTNDIIKLIQKEGLNPHQYQIDMLNYYEEVMKLELLDIIKESLNKVKASDINIYDSRNISPFYDYIVLATVNTTRQSEAVKSYLEDFIKDTPYKIRGEEGINTNWYLIDLNSVIISILTKEERERLDLDNLYSNLNEVDI